MEKNEQAKINVLCINFIIIAAQEFNTRHSPFEELEGTTAVISTTSNYVVLLSRGHIVAFFNISMGIMVDILRYECSYNAFSSHHIAEFRRLMNKLYGVRDILCYYPI